MGRRNSQYSEHFPMVCFGSLYAQLDFFNTQLNFLYVQLISFHILNETFFWSINHFSHGQHDFLMSCIYFIDGS